jgi:hypothetical protein
MEKHLSQEAPRLANARKHLSQEAWWLQPPLLDLRRRGSLGRGNEQLKRFWQGQGDVLEASVYCGGGQRRRLHFDSGYCGRRWRGRVCGLHFIGDRGGYFLPGHYVGLDTKGNARPRQYSARDKTWWQCAREGSGARLCAWYVGKALVEGGGGWDRQPVTNASLACQVASLAGSTSGPWDNIARRAGGRCFGL